MSPRSRGSVGLSECPSALPSISPNFEFRSTISSSSARRLLLKRIESELLLCPRKWQLSIHLSKAKEDGMCNQHEREHLQLCGFERIRGQKKFIFTWDWKD